jgi:energy-coupling factor transport system ATP-binding protein
MSIIIENLTYTYSPKTPFAKVAIDNISLEINDGEFFGIIGHTGSGKSTLIQHLNALTRVMEGKIIIDGVDITPAKIDFKKLRAHVGMVFQYPEYQLFDETVQKDVSFGPKNLGLSQEEIFERSKEAITLVGLDFEEFKDRSPFELSGGQKRRVAIAGVIAMRPKILVLDEPTAGLDPSGKQEIIELITSLKKNISPTIIMISHDMNEIAEVCDRVAVLNDGKIEFLLPPHELFKEEKRLVELGLDIPSIAKLVNILNEKGKNVPTDIFTVEQMYDYVVDKVKRKE